MRLPPLNALRAFEAAARHGGFIDAADELHVTRGAISRHVKSLEDHLGVTLFRRHARGVELNEAGKALLPVLTDAFHRIADGVERISSVRADLRIICPPATSIRWLMPRIGEFRDSHPDYRVQITTDYYMRAGFDTSAFNLGISVEFWQNRTSETRMQPLVPLVITPACSPEMAEKLRSPADLASVQLLHERHERSDWKYWLSAFEVPGVDVSTGDVFHNLDMATKAAEIGMGVVMADLLLCRDELASGRLVIPFPDMMCDTPVGRFALLGTADDWESPAIRDFRGWIGTLAEADTRAIFGSATWKRTIPANR